MSGAMTTPELLPCPFCGGYAAYQVGFGVICQRCEVGLPSTLDGAATAWNTRAPMSPAALAALPEVRDLLRRAYAAGWDAYHAQQQADWTDTRGVEATRSADLDAIAPAPDLAALPEVKALLVEEGWRLHRLAALKGEAMAGTGATAATDAICAAIAAAIREGRT